MNLLCTIYRSADQIRTALEGGPVTTILTTPEGNTLTTPAGDTLTTPEIEYRADIIEDIEISRSLPDIFYGVQRTDPITIRLANADNGVDATWDEIAAEEELRGLRVVLSRDVFTYLCAGKITDYTLGLESSITIEPRDDEVFEALLPAGVVTAAIFETTALNIGAVIPINFGWCKGVPCPNIQNNLTDDYYDYLIGIGTHESLWIDHANGRGIKRDGVLVAESEYTFYDGSQVSPHAGYSFIRFIVEQKGFQNEYLPINADVKGLELDGSTADRSFANQIKAIISNTTWGLSESVNAASFATAATALPTATWKCDITLYEQKKARDYLDDLLFACRSWLFKNADGEWEIQVDGTGSSVLSLGENDGYYNNCDCKSCGVTPTSNTIKTAYVRYDNEIKQISLAVHTTFGIDKTFEIPCVIDDDTAKKVLSYIYGRATYADKKLQLSCTSEAADVLPGNIVTVTIPNRDITAITYKVTGISKAVDKYILDCEVYDSRIFDDQVITAPTASDSSLVAHGIQVIDSGTVGGWAVNGTTLSYGTNIILDAANKKISINSATFGAKGIQLDYNSGTPRFYAGDGSTKFINFDGTDTKGNFSDVVNMAVQGGANVSGPFSGANAQTIANETYTVIDWPTEDWDTQNEFNTTTNKYTMAQDGKMLITGQIASEYIAYAAIKEWHLSLYVNGARVKTGAGISHVAEDLVLIALLSTGLDLEASDYIELKAWHNRGSDTDINADANYHHLNFACFQKLA